MSAPIETAAIGTPGGVAARVLSHGARLQSLDVADRQGARDSVVLGFADTDAYARDTCFIGGVIGRYANRIAGGRFDLGGRTIALPRNDGANHLHGGPHGFDTRQWHSDTSDDGSVTLSLVSPDGDEGYPGTLTAHVCYTAGEATLDIDLTATTDAPTIVNLTHHAYLNLAGQRAATPITDHWLHIPASRFTPIDATAIPTGELREVSGTPFDFQTAKPIGRDIDAADDQFRLAGGYDHNFVLDGHDGRLRRAATLYDPGSGRVLDLLTTAPGLQFYSGNALTSMDPGLGGRRYRPRDGLCLEPQLFPDSPNRRAFPSARLDPGNTYRHHIRFAFRTAASVEEAFAGC